MTELIIGKRYCGPSTSGNGGYTCGLLASGLSGDVEVTLRLPPPLDKSLQLASESERLCLYDAGQLIAEARATQLELEVPQPPTLAQARESEGRFAGHAHHAFPNCFVCGTGRTPGDGLRIFTGPTGNGEMVAASWTPDASLLDKSDTVRSEFLWAAIDCAGSWAPDPRPPKLVLGRFTASIRSQMHGDETGIVIGWPLAIDGRKYQVGSALFGADARLIACAQATWIALRD